MRASQQQKTRLCAVMAAALCAAGAGPLALSGCADGPTMLVITGAVAPVAGAEGGCVASPTTDELMTGGVLDVAVAQGYGVAVKVQNVAPRSGDTGAKPQGSTGGMQQGGGGVFENLDLEGNSIFVKKAGVDFDIKAELADVDLAGFDVPIGGPMVEPSGGEAAFFVPVLTPFQVEQLRSVIAPGQSALIIAKIKMSGETASETDVETNSFGFPITVCNGCLGRTCTESEAAELESARTQGCYRPGADQSYCATIVPDVEEELP